MTALNFADIANDPLLLGIVLALVVVVLTAWAVYKSSSGDAGADISRGLRREQALSSSSNLTDGLAADDGRVLSPLQFKPFTVVATTDASYNTKLVRFEITGNRELGLTVGRHVSAKAEINGIKVIRSYTPTSRPDTKGYFELLIKKYHDGKLTPYIHDLQVGDTLDFRGPVGRFKWEKSEQPRRMGLIAGGTGLTPCLQVIRCILEGPEGESDNTNFVLFFQNRTERDVLLEYELRTLSAQYPTRLKVCFFLSNPQSEDWGKDFTQTGALDRFFRTRGATGEPAHVRGYINAAAIRAAMGVHVCPQVSLCGPAGFNDSMKQLLMAEGHSDESLYIW